MRTNLELAIFDVLSSSPSINPSPSTEITPDIHLATVICAYIRIAGFAEPQQALTSFARALDKHPDYRDKSGSEQARYAKVVSGLRKEYWRDVLSKSSTESGNGSGKEGGGAEGPWKGLFSCPCCGKLVRKDKITKALNLDDRSGEQDLGQCGSDGGCLILSRLLPVQYNR